MTQPVALFDLDNTLADYLGALRDGMNALAAPGEEPWLPMRRGTEPPHITARRKMVTHQTGWWRNLPIHNPGLQIFVAAKEIGFEPHFLTKGPRSHSLAWGEKVEWVDKHFPEHPITLSDDKSLVYSRVLVDDWPEYFEPWLANRPRGAVIVPAQPWNEKFAEPHHTGRVVRYDGTNLDQVMHLLGWAFNRESRRVYPRPSSSARNFMAMWAYAVAGGCGYESILPCWQKANLPFDADIPQEAYNEEFAIAWYRINSLIMDPDAIPGHWDTLQVEWDPDVDLLEWVPKDIRDRAKERFLREQPWGMEDTRVHPPGPSAEEMDAVIDSILAPLKA